LIKSSLPRDSHLGRDELPDSGLARNANGHAVVLLPFQREGEEGTAATLQADPLGELGEGRGISAECQGNAIRELVRGEDRSSGLFDSGASMRLCSRAVTPQDTVATTERLEEDVHLRRRALPFVLSASAGVLLGLARPAHTQTVNVRVTIEQIEALDCVDESGGICRSKADLYAVVTIDDEEFTQCGPPGYSCVASANFDSDSVSPNWEVSKPIDLSRGSIPVRIAVWDDDDRFGDAWPDDHVDLDGDGSSRDLDLTVNFASCGLTPSAGTTGVTGDVTGACGASLSQAGTADDRARIRFRIDVDPPPATANLNVMCTHAPIWPQQGDTVKFTANARDGGLASVAASAIEIWVDDRTAPKVTCPIASTCSLTFATTANPTLAYGCRIVNTTAAGTDTVWTGWRVVNVGPPASGRAASLGSTGPQGSRIDVVFVADKDEYTGASDPNFLSDVGTVVRNAYYNDLFYLSHQHQMSFWLATDRGDAGGFTGTPPRCNLSPPDGWDDAYAFADVGALVHRTCFRDCALGVDDRLFSAEVSGGDFDGNKDGDCKDVGDTDLNGNGTCDVDVDANGDGDCADPGDTDTNGNGTCEKDIDFNSDGDCKDAFPPGDTDFNGDGVCQVDKDANGDGDCADPGDTDANGDGACDSDTDLNGDGDCTDAGETDTNGNGFCDVDIDRNADGDCGDRADRDCNNNGSCDSCNSDCPSTQTLRTFLHETGHVPFGLADEYCCDGGYFQADPLPNLYDEKGAELGAASPTCSADSGDLGRSSSACQGFQGQHLPFFRDFDWFKSEPPTNDLMKDNQTPQGADVRRINYVFDRCRGGKC
jgi:hypothetical protein